MLFNIVVMFYAFSLFTMLGLGNMIVILILLECLSWLFTFFVTKNVVIKYLLIQSVFFMVMILGLLWSKPLLILGMMIKMGLPPFHSWLLNLSQFLEKNTFLFFTTLHKVAPMFFLMKSLYFNFLLITMSIMLFSVLLMMEAGSLYFVMIFSSIVHSGWMMIMCFLSYALLFFYWSTYTVLMYLFFNSLKSKELLVSDKSQNSLLSIMWLVICGLPPFTMFWLKVGILSLLFMKTFFFSVILMIIPILTLVVYYRIFHLSLLSSKMMPQWSLMISIFLGVGWF